MQQVKRTQTHNLKRSKQLGCARASQPCSLALAISALLCGVTAPVYAADNAYNLDEITISTTRTQETVGESHRSVAITDRETLDQRQPKSVPEAVASLPNVSIQGGSRPSNQTVNIRGLSGSRVLQTLDGVRQDFHSGHRPDYLLPPELISRIEVLKGPVSSLWGSGAIGGVVAQQSLTPDEVLKDDASFGGLVKTGHNSNSDMQSSVVALAGREASVSWLLGGFGRSGNDLEQGDGATLEGSAIDDNGGLARLQWEIDADQSLDLSYLEANGEGQVPSNGAAPSNPTSNFMIDRDTRTRNYRLGYQLNTASPLVDAQLTLWRNEVEMDESRVSDGRGDNTELDAYGFNLSNRSDLGRWRLVYGLDSYREDFVGNRSGANRPIPPHGQTDNLGAFVQARVDLNDQWMAEFGGRLDRFSTDADGMEERSDSAFSPAAALTWQPVPWGDLSLRHERAFRAPGVEELYTTGTHFCMMPGFCNTFQSNPDLDAEEAANTELTANGYWTGLAGDDQLNLQLSIFENRVDNFIEQIVTNPSFGPVMDPGYTTWVNVDKAKIRGIELSTRYRINAFKVELGYGITRGEDLETGEDLTNIPADTLTADLSYRFWRDQMLAGVRLEHARDQNLTDYAENSSDTRYDGYTLTDLYLGWTPQSVPGLSLDLTVNNLADTHYRRAWENLDEAGREIILSTTYRF